MFVILAQKKDCNCVNSDFDKIQTEELQYMDILSPVAESC